jgi:hypothetical protein
MSCPAINTGEGNGQSKSRSAWLQMLVGITGKKENLSRSLTYEYTGSPAPGIDFPKGTRGTNTWVKFE